MIISEEFKYYFFYFTRKLSRFASVFHSAPVFPSYR